MAIRGGGRQAAHTVDIHVGGRIRLRRKYLGVSQQAIADPLDLTFQQVQKYESGDNRVSASKLYEIARILKVPVVYFFDGLDGTPEALSPSGHEDMAHAFLFTKEGLELAEAFPRVQNSKRRRKVLDLVRTLAEEDD
ncbi:MAG: helix-turn-helix domain-containing protein [Asticcacaulis sp.]|uniref:helix-turn-helix domain-containing protein n=1 Tax=Asticcacaulis sp. TaxID=1872648 RepID=UPI003F7C293D